MIDYNMYGIIHIILLVGLYTYLSDAYYHWFYNILYIIKSMILYKSTVFYQNAQHFLHILFGTSNGS